MERGPGLYPRVRRGRSNRNQSPTKEVRLTTRGRVTVVFRLCRVIDCHRTSVSTPTSTGPPSHHSLTGRRDHGLGGGRVRVRGKPLRSTDPNFVFRSYNSPDSSGTEPRIRNLHSQGSWVRKDLRKQILLLSSRVCVPTCQQEVDSQKFRGVSIETKKFWSTDREILFYVITRG